MDRRQFMFNAAAAAAASAALPGVASAQTFPDRPIRLVNGFGPGSSADVLSRLIAPIMQRALGQVIVVDAVQGAAGNIAAQAVTRAKPDGYTLLMSLNYTFGTNAHLLPAQFDPLTAFTPIMPTANMGCVIVAGPSAPAKTWSGVLEASKRQTVTYCTPGVGTSLHLVGEMLRERTKGNFMHVPYKGGAQASTDLLGGQVALGILGYAPTAGAIQAGSLKPLAVCGATRLSALPDVPALPELVPGITLGSWGGLFAPAGTPAEICRLIADAADKALRDANVIAQMSASGLDRINGGPEDLRRMLKAEYDQTGEVIRRLNIRL